MERLTLTTKPKDSFVMVEPSPHPIDQLLQLPVTLPRQRVLFLNGIPHLEQPWINTPPLVIAGVASQELAYQILQKKSALSPDELKTRFDLAEQTCNRTRHITEEVMGENYYTDDAAQKELVALASHIMLHPKEEVRQECTTWLQSFTDGLTHTK